MAAICTRSHNKCRPYTILDRTEADSSVSTIRFSGISDIVAGLGSIIIIMVRLRFLINYTVIIIIIVIIFFEIV